MRKINILILFMVMLVFSGCIKEMLSPADDNHSTLDRIYNDPNFADGLIVNAYNRLPMNSYAFSEVATDDAVTNDKFSSYAANGNRYVVSPEQSRGTMEKLLHSNHVPQ